MRLIASIKADIQFQFRHYFYYVYLFVSTFYILILSFVPIEVKEKTALVFLFSDCSFLGSFFIGGIILLEKDQGIHNQLFVTPIRISEFIWSKVISLSVLSAASAMLIYICTFGLTYKALPLLLGVLFNSVFATLLGLIFAVRVKSINQYLLISPLFVTVFFLPILDVIDLFHTPLFYLLPGKAGLLLMENAFSPLSVEGWIYSLSTLFLFIILAFQLAYQSFTKHVLLKIGG
ncbi:fluoroquinolone export ABC transporter permease subunit [Cytobacillus dafuensis]|uniref:ABC transporter permease n=1 Tax=Cytobacillus dafuensis TaxID=1742359 RepID=A0A5B8Z9I6_CYTDA|nr:hypothetical protein [Cytobacillus dafuensis]QED49802.1 hypothetical protein FSZ17_22395 [Cytobacillus dafuensis]